MEQNSRKNAVINFLVLLVVSSCLYAIGRYSHSYAAQVGSIFLGIGTLVALVSIFHMRLEERERIEKLEFEEVSKSAGAPVCSREKAEIRFPRNARENSSSGPSFRGLRSCCFLSSSLARILPGATWRELPWCPSGSHWWRWIKWPVRVNPLFARKI